MLKNLRLFLKESSFIEKVVYIYIIVLPIAHGYWSFSFIKEKILLADLLFLIILPAWVLHKFKNKPLIKFIPENRIYLFIAFLLLITLYSFANSINLKHSAIDWFGLLYLGMLFLIITDTIDSKGGFKRLLIIYSISAVMFALIGLGAFAYSSIAREAAKNPFLFSHPAEASVIFFPRIKSFFYTPNMFASFEHVALAVIASLFFLIKKERRVNSSEVCLFIASFVIVLGCVFLAGSQTFAGIILTVFMLLYFIKGKFISIVRYITFLFAVVVIIFVFCATIWMIYPVKIDNARQDKTLTIHINYAWSQHITPSIYAISMFKDHPFLGVGIGTFIDQLPRYQNSEVEKLSSERMGIPEKTVRDPHNTYTGALAEWGILGFLAVVALFAQFITIFMRSNNYGENILLDGVGFSLFAGFVGFIFNGFFIDIMMMRHFWIFMAMLAIFYKLRKNHAI